MFRFSELLPTVMRAMAAPLRLPLGASCRDAPGDRPVMTTERCEVDGRVVTYGLADGDGPTVLLLHGWGLSHHSYAAPAAALAGHGYRVVSPDLPGFGDSHDLPLDRITFAAFSHVLHKLVVATRPDGARRGAPVDPVHVIGHSFGGAVAVQFAHDDPALVRSLVLVDAASGSVWHRVGEDVRLVADRPIWDWGLHLLREFPLGQFPGPSLAVLRDVAHNAIVHPLSLGLVAHLIRHSDVHVELAAVAGARVPVSVLWAGSDRVVTRTEFEDQCEAARCTGTEVPGNHGWLMNDPEAFGATVARELARSAGRGAGRRRRGPTSARGGGARGGGARGGGARGDPRPKSA